ncbi:MAG: beta-glucuronidase [Bacteroides sp.]|nr:beta-glucuronidase [Bacteroides sp.]
MKARIYIVLFTVFFCIPAFGLQSKLQNVYSRNITSLNGYWQTIVDPLDVGYYDYRMNFNKYGYFKNQQAESPLDLIQYDFSTEEQLVVPGDWNTQKKEFFFYEGSIWYKKDFTYQKKEDTRLYLYFGAANYEANVFLNGEHLGSHIGGFTPFNYDITDKVREGNNFVVVRVNNKLKPDDVPTSNTDWWNYGGITRDVLLVETPSVSVDDYLVQLEKGRYDRIQGFVKLNTRQAGVKIKLEIPELKVKAQLTTDTEGKADFHIKSTPKCWSPESPQLYDVIITNGTEQIKDRIGFRQIETKGKNILLNGKKVFFRGICIHEEAPYRQGRVHSREEAEILLKWAKELNCNFVRLAHYPHSEHMVRAAEEMGLMVWDEIPVYWTIAFGNKETYQNASQQLIDMMERDKNRCAVVVWSLANETPESEDRNTFLANLSKQAKQMDNTRLISMAMEVGGTRDNVTSIQDGMNKYVDIISFNNYLGWYGGRIDDCKTRKWNIPYDKPVFISEWGGGALQGYHADKNTRWSEEFLAELYRQSIAMYDRLEGFAGMSPWILVDFRSARRQHHTYQNFFNRKGLISENGIKKQAFYVLRDFYAKKKMEYEQ